MIDHKSKPWNKAATAGALSEFDGELPPRIPRSITNWMAFSMGNNEEAQRRNNTPIVASVFACSAVVMIAMLAALGAW